MMNQREAIGDDLLALDIPTLARRTLVGRTRIYDEIKQGRLKARKVGRRTIVLAEDARAWLASAPLMQAA